MILPAPCSPASSPPPAASGEVHWSSLIPEKEWALYKSVIEAARAQKIPFALGGGFAFSTYVQRWRNTKDVDLYILPADRDPMIRLLAHLDFTDYFDIHPYDRSWIYRGYRDGVICDLIWAMANHRADTDPRWLTHGREIQIQGLTLPILPPEELLWAKLYVLQRDRCDWPDLLNIINSEGPNVDWEHLLARVGEDAPLIASLLTLFSWMCPASAHELPAWLWPRLGLAVPPSGPSCEIDRRRVKLLDSRDWFGPTLPPPPLAPPVSPHQ